MNATLAQEAPSLTEAAEAIDLLMDDADGTLLAAAAVIKTNILRFYKREGLVAELKNAVNGAHSVRFFSKRSEREISTTRPEVNLAVDHAKASQRPEFKALYQKWPDGNLGNGSGRSGASDDQIDSVTASVIHAEVCVPFAAALMAKMGPQWVKAKEILAGRDARLMLATIFEISVEQTPAHIKGTPQAKAASDRSCGLRLFL